MAVRQVCYAMHATVQGDIIFNFNRSIQAQAC